MPFKFEIMVVAFFQKNLSLHYHDMQPIRFITLKISNRLKLWDLEEKR